MMLEIAGGIVTAFFAILAILFVFRNLGVILVGLGLLACVGVLVASVVSQLAG